jgi:hypothetical protein
MRRLRREVVVCGMAIRRKPAMLMVKSPLLQGLTDWSKLDKAILQNLASPGLSPKEPT